MLILEIYFTVFFHHFHFSCFFFFNLKHGGTLPPWNYRFHAYRIPPPHPHPRVFSPLLYHCLRVPFQLLTPSLVNSPPFLSSVLLTNSRVLLSLIICYPYNLFPYIPHVKNRWFCICSSPFCYLHWAWNRQIYPHNNKWHDLI